MDLIKPVGNEITGNAALSSFSNTRLLKIVTTGNTVATRYDSSNNQIANTTLLGEALYFLAKEPTDQWTFSANVLVTPIAFQI